MSAPWALDGPMNKVAFESWFSDNYQPICSRHCKRESPLRFKSLFSIKPVLSQGR